MDKEEKKWFGKGGWARYGILMAATAIMLLIMPRADHQSYSFELNQPWKYPLLTAEFDTPIFRDTISARDMRDSINANFIPFIKRLGDVSQQNVDKFSRLLADSVSAGDASLLSNLLSQVYARGVMAPGLSSTVRKMKINKVRKVDSADTTSILSQDASQFFTTGEAFDYVDSVYNQSKGLAQGAMTPYMSQALYNSLDGNIVIDTVADDRFRSKELLEVTAALGVIKEGQRIVDRGEIINNQIFTNLTTYMKTLEERDENNMSQTYYTIGRGIIIIMILICLYMFMANYKLPVYHSLRDLSFIMGYVTLFVVFAVLMFEFVPNGLSMVPFAAVPVVVLVFFDAWVGIICLIAAVLITSLVATFPQQFIIMELIAGICATVSINQLTRRSQLLVTAVITWVVYSIIYTGMQFVVEGNLSMLNYNFFGYYGINAVIFSFTYMLIALVEKICGFTSNVTLVELNDINHPLLRQLAENAPGTFQHSVQVSNLAAEAARAIDANTLLVRTGALYHDIGKLESPAFYTENQHGVNPHTGLDPETSAKKIISHVTSGAALAKEHKLPREIRDFIMQHHGTGLTRYFYNTAVNDRGEENINKRNFQYPGPAPQSKETAILMMADAVEAASRSLKDYSPQAITNLVNKIVDGQLADGMFKEAPITLKEIEKVKSTFIKRLGTLYHTRISYPELNREKTKNKEGTSVTADSTSTPEK